MTELHPAHPDGVSYVERSTMGHMNDLWWVAIALMLSCAAAGMIVGFGLGWIAHGGNS